MSPKLRNGLLIGGGVIIALCVLLVAVLTLLGPATGAVFSTTVSSMPYPTGVVGQRAAGGGGYPQDQAGAAPPAAEGFAAQPEFAVMPTEAPAVNTNLQQQTAERLIIRNGSITVAVNDTHAARQAIEGMVAQLAGDGAFVVSVNEYGGETGANPYIDMSIRIPAAHFDEVMNQIAALAAEGTTPTQSQSAQDVTSEYVDLQSRLGALEAARQRLLEIMSEAQTTQDLLYAEQQLTQREAEIESIKGQMQYLSQSAALSSITISLQPYILAQPVDNRWRPAETVRHAWQTLLDSLRGFADFVIIFGIDVLPWLVAFGLIVYGIVRFVRGRVRKGREKQAVVESQE